MIYTSATSHKELERWQAEGQAYYARSSHPLVEQVEQIIAKMEGARGAIATSSGMSALMMILASLHCDRKTHIWSHDGAFPATNELAWYWSKQTKCAFTQVERQEYSLSNKEKNIVLLQNPYSDTLESFNVPKVIARIKRQDSRAIVVVDNSITTPRLLRPLQHGADIVWESMSKYLSGHGTVLAGVACTNNAALLRSWKIDERYLFGNILAPQVAEEILRGIETFNVRLDRITTSAATVAKYLRSCSWVSNCRQVCGLISFRCEEAEWVVNSLQRFELTVHWGNVKSAVVYDESTKYVKLSIGLEDPDDLIDDLRRAFRRNFLTM